MDTYEMHTDSTPRERKPKSKRPLKKECKTTTVVITETYDFEDGERVETTYRIPLTLSVVKEHIRGNRMAELVASLRAVGVMRIKNYATNDAYTVTQVWEIPWMENPYIYIEGAAFGEKQQPEALAA